MEAGQLPQALASKPKQDKPDKPPTKQQLAVKHVEAVVGAAMATEDPDNLLLLRRLQDRINACVLRVTSLFECGIL